MEFGRLERVGLRQAWTHEATGFTPWLALPDNLKLLGDTIGIDLELEAQEANVGPFRADILCKDTLTDHWVLIENQLERTDHTHLGQLLTYAAGLKAVTIVWIANAFTSEHRAALDWLNEITDSKFNFFGLEVQLWRIGDSQVAPKFNAVCSPNNWSKTVAEGAAKVEAGALTEGRRLQLAFWTGFSDFLLRNESRVRPVSPQPQQWLSFGIGRAGCSLHTIASLKNSESRSADSNEVRVQLELKNDLSKPWFDELYRDADAIASELGYAPTWRRLDNSQSSLISVRRVCDLRDENSWPELYAWLLERLNDFHRVFQSRVKALGGAESIEQADEPIE